MALFPLIFGLLVLCLLALGCVKSIVALVRVALPERPLKAPRCVACGYDISGLPTWTCPECGRDLRRVGVLGTHQRQRPPGKVLSEAIAGLTVLFLIVVGGVEYTLGVLGNITAWWACPLIAGVVLYVIAFACTVYLHARTGRRYNAEILRPIEGANSVPARD